LENVSVFLYGSMVGSGVYELKNVFPRL